MVCFLPLLMFIWEVWRLLAVLLSDLLDCSFADCDKITTNGCELSIATDVKNCGGCGIVATLPNANATCSSGKAVVSSCLTG
jgi:hypothetical protein